MGVFKGFGKCFEEWCKKNRFRKQSDVAIKAFMRDKEITDGRIETEWHTEEGKKK